MFYYFEKYDVRDGDSEYVCTQLRELTEPLTEEKWLREFAEFSWKTCGDEPWEETRIQEFLADEDREVEVYGGQRIYSNVDLREIPKEHYDILRKYL